METPGKNERKRPSDASRWRLSKKRRNSWPISCARRSESFIEVPFCPVDSLVLSSLVYLNLDEYRYGNVHGAESVPVIDILRFTPLRSMLGRLARRRRRAARLSARACMQPPLCRFKREPVRKRDRRNHREAVLRVHRSPWARKTAPLLAYLAFRGTDGTIAGWKEDFNLSYMPVIPSQKTATAYVSGVLGAARRYADICGRPLERRQPRRIRRAYHRRGRLRAHQARVQPRWPEFSRSALAAHRRARNSRRSSTKPCLSLPYSDDSGKPRRLPHRAVERDGLLPARAIHLIVDGHDFSTQRTLNNSAKMFDITLDRWLRSCSQHEREVFIDTMYDLITSSDAKSWADFQSSFMSNMATFMRDGRKPRRPKPRKSWRMQSRTWATWPATRCANAWAPRSSA